MKLTACGKRRRIVLRCPKISYFFKNGPEKKERFVYLCEKSFLLQKIREPGKSKEIWGKQGDSEEIQKKSNRGRIEKEWQRKNKKEITANQERNREGFELRFWEGKTTKPKSEKPQNKPSQTIKNERKEL